MSRAFCCSRSDHSNEAMIRSMQSTTAFIQCNGPFYSDMNRIYPEDYGGTFTAVNYLLQRGTAAFSASAATCVPGILPRRWPSAA